MIKMTIYTRNKDFISIWTSIILRNQFFFEFLAHNNSFALEISPSSPYKPVLQTKLVVWQSCLNAIQTLPIGKTVLPSLFMYCFVLFSIYNSILPIFFMSLIVITMIIWTMFTHFHLVCYALSLICTNYTPCGVSCQVKFLGNSSPTKQSLEGVFLPESIK